MRCSWPTKRFGDCAGLIRNTCLPGDFKGMPYIGLEHIEERSLRLSCLGTTNDVTSSKSRFDAGDILFGKLRPYFRKVVMPVFSGLCSTDIWVVRAKKGTDQRYLFYWMASQEFVDLATQASEGTKMPRAKWDFLESIEKPVPPLTEQHAIADILGTLDDKIELNRRMNQTLEAMAQALFKIWFVDFEPFRDHGMQDSAMGEIPRGWRVGRVDDIAVLHRESVNPSHYPEEIFAHYSIAAYDEGPMPKAETGEAMRSSKLRIPSGAVLISKLNPRFPRVWLTFDSNDKRSVGSTEFLVATPRGDVSREYIYCLFSSRSFLDTFSALVTGTSGSHQRVRPQDLMTIDAVTPPTRVTTAFSKTVSPLYALVNRNLCENATIADIRDALLPKLLSGEIRAEDAESFVEDAI